MPPPESNITYSCWQTFSLSVSSAEVASSRRRIFGFLTIARAIATRCFSPPLNCVPLSPTFVSYPCHRSSNASKVITRCGRLLWLLIITFSLLLFLLIYYPHTLTNPIITIEPSSNSQADWSQICNGHEIAVSHDTLVHTTIDSGITYTNYNYNQNVRANS